ncbi:type IX secretion system anionic LPS delivery protein PorZ [Carboxylicivirga taeanensis]|uniref:type IX secretion system anionic LPS delivery protein PorZ n=1 Tax=Carboxylicivirga taeanensis TaxID=1416875 RepID=UPI003F6DE470
MRKLILLTLILFIAPIVFLFGQDSRWRAHFSYRNANNVVESENYVTIACDMGLLVFDKLNKEISTFNRVNGLSDVGITALQSISGDKFIVGYENGNIDVISGSEVTNIPDFKQKQIAGTKQINHFYISDHKAYCSTDYALLVVDLEKNEISDTYFLGLNAESLKINETHVQGDVIYAATERGLLKANLSDPLIVFDKAWRRVSAEAVPYLAVNIHEGQIVAVGKVSDGYRVEHGNENAWSSLLTDSQVKSINVFAGKLVVSLSSRILVFNENFTESDRITSYSFADRLSAQDAIYSSYEDAYFVADRNYGLVQYTHAADNFYLANGPYSNNCFYLHATSQGVYSTAGGITADYNNLNRRVEYSFFNYSNWDSYRSKVPGGGYTTRDLLRICSDKTDDSKAYISSWGGGIFEVQGVDTIQHHGESDNGLQDIFPDGRMYVRVGGIASDSEGNVWMTNSEVQSGIVVKSDSAWYQFDYAGARDIHSTGQMLITKDDMVWFPIPRAAVGERQGLMVIDTKGTLLDDSDDAYRSGAPLGYGNDERNKGQLRLWDENGKELTRVILSLAEDKKGYVWLGTDKGVLVYFRPWAIFTEEYPIVSRIKVPRNDGSNLADYLLEKERVSSIAVDGANRKWIGTENSGVYLVSEDGLKTYATFNTQNSPLPSNSITSITISPANGEVFIGTAKGIVSYKATATEGAAGFEKIYAYPNPVREDFNGDITIAGLMQNSIVKITTVSGKLVYQTNSLGGKAYWNGKNFGGERVKTGVYLVYVSDEGGELSGVTKILVVR